jgi:formylglycine-generating enzyme required for sulfatase activity
VEGGIDRGNHATYDGDAGTDGIGSPYYRTVVGEWENSASPYGTFDQGGNVWEWNEAIIGSSRGKRGGSFLYSDGADSLHAPARSYSDPASFGDYIGFRVVQVPQPGCALMLAFAFLGVVSRRRRV